ncbi:MAG: large-conductance mechanosensitive channel protein MscL [Oscillospiraceae bacterium]|nr:large-conductance mechanosensitive channel protein MscL [Oscillospiraceae bacterium]
MKKIIAEFKEFISRGNVMDMAIGVIIATAFGKITTSLVNDVLMPFISWLVGARDMSALNLLVRPEVLNDAGEVVQESITIGFGTLLGTVIDFVLVALVVFAIVKAANMARARLEKQKEAEEEAAPEPSNEEKLLAEIRDLLKNQK